MLYVIGLLVICLMISCVSCYMASNTSTLVKDIHKDIRTAAERVNDRNMATKKRQLQMMQQKKQQTQQLPKQQPMDYFPKPTPAPIPTMSAMQREYANDKPMAPPPPMTPAVNQMEQRLRPRGNDPTARM